MKLVVDLLMSLYDAKVKGDGDYVLCFGKKFDTKAFYWALLQ